MHGNGKQHVTYRIRCTAMGKKKLRTECTAGLASLAPVWSEPLPPHPQPLEHHDVTVSEPHPCPSPHFPHPIHPPSQPSIQEHVPERKDACWHAFANVTTAHGRTAPALGWLGCVVKHGYVAGPWSMVHGRPPHGIPMAL